MEPIFKEAQAMQQQIVEWRRALHQIPEVGLATPKTAAFVKERLLEMGLSVQEYEGHSGLTATIGQGGKTVALRADMDALAISEESGVPFASQNGNMHACGHDSHAAMLLAAAQLLKRHEPELAGTVKLIFQSGEEGPGGADPLVRAGALDGVDYILALHTGDIAGYFEPGQIAVSYADTFASDTLAVIEVHGLGGHASTPHLCVDTMAIATLIINNIQYIISREVDTRAPSVLTITSIQTDSEALNAIPNVVTIYGSVRNSSQETHEFVLKRIREIAQGTAAMMRASDCKVTYYTYPALVNDRSVVESFLNTARKLLKDDEINILPHGIMGGEDAGFLFQKVPGCYFFLPNSAPCPTDGKRYGVHHPKFCMDESVLWKGTALLSQAAIDLFQ